MYYIDLQRTLTRRESSLIRSESIDWKSPKNTLVNNTPNTRPKGAVRKEIITIMFDSMLHYITDSWEKFTPDETASLVEKTPSVNTVNPRGRKSTAKPRPKRSRSKVDSNDGSDSTQPWSCPDERAIIRFKNGNTYEGNISMKCMHGEGRFQWANGTVYMGQFVDNAMTGKGTIYWKDDTWYQGEFLNNMRHGQGMYVNSRTQSSYIGGWYCGTKHGQGVIYYKSFTNSYDGNWNHNVRHGYGSREYDSSSGFKGNWDKYVREGNGVMIWPNHDVYRGGWKNGVMSGYGIYIWGAHYNNTLSVPSICAYRGDWERGQRHGYGFLNFGFGFGAHYKGEFKNNLKHGSGKLVTNNGLILKSKKLFLDDIMALKSTNIDFKAQKIEPYTFDMNNDYVDLVYHIAQALNYIDKQEEMRASLLDDYFKNNKVLVSSPRQNFSSSCLPLEDIILFEKNSLVKALRCYETDLKRIYYKYATICNTEEITFTPILTHLYLWQFYNDCNVHNYNLYLVEIDKLLYKNPEWLLRAPHDPFEKIYFWQFIHSLITVACRLYSTKTLPGPKPDTMVANAFRLFMERNALKAEGARKGRLPYDYATFVPLKSTYQLYRSIGEPHSVRKFLRSIRPSPHSVDEPNLLMIEPFDIPVGHNFYVFGDEMMFITDEDFRLQNNDENGPQRYKLFNFSNLSCKCIIEIFSNMFPEIYCNDKIINLDIEITFYEFFEAFVECAEKSIFFKEEERLLNENLASIPKPK